MGPEGEPRDYETSGERLAQDDFLAGVKYLRANFIDVEARIFEDGAEDEVAQHHYSMVAENVIPKLAPIVVQRWDEAVGDYYAFGDYSINHAKNGRNRFSFDQAGMRNEFMRNSVEVAERKRMAKPEVRTQMHATGEVKEFLSPEPTTGEMLADVKKKLQYDRTLYRFNWVDQASGDMYTQSYSILDLPAEAIAQYRGLEDQTALAVMRDSNMREHFADITPYQKVEQLIHGCLPFISDRQTQLSLLTQLDAFREDQEALEQLAWRYTEEDMLFMTELAASINISSEEITRFVNEQYPQAKPAIKAMIDQNRLHDGFAMNEDFELLVWGLHTVLLHNRAGIVSGDQRTIDRVIQSYTDTIGIDDGTRLAQQMIDQVIGAERQMLQYDIGSEDYASLKQQNNKEIAATNPSCGGSCGPELEDMYRDTTAGERAIGLALGINAEKRNYFARCKNKECGAVGMLQEGIGTSAIYACPACSSNSRDGVKSKDHEATTKTTFEKLTGRKQGQDEVDPNEDTEQPATVIDIRRRHTEQLRARFGEAVTANSDVQLAA